MVTRGSRILVAAAFGVALACPGQVRVRPVATLSNQALVASDLPPMTLHAASATPGGKTEVRLRWMFHEGWTPEGVGFNVFKVVGGVKTGPLNPRPIAADERKFQVSALATRMRVAPKFDVLQALHTARQQIPNVDRKTLFSFDRQARTLTLAAPSFAALKSHINQFAGARPQALTPMNRLLQAALEHPDVRPYASKLGITLDARARFLNRAFPGPTIRGVVPVTAPAAAITGGGQAAPTAVRPLTTTARLTPTPSSPPPAQTLMAIRKPADLVREARGALAMGALTSPAIADGLGLSFTDTTAQNGQSIQYLLTFVRTGGASVDMANTTIAVGADLQPQAPEGLDATQVGVNRVWLYWKPAPDNLREALVLPSYRVVRVDAAHPQGVDVTGSPVLKSRQASADNPNELVEPLFSFADAAAPVGPVTYKVSMTDAFGRESATASSVSITVQDWETPQPVGVIKTKLNGSNQPVVMWTASVTPGSKYRVYRVDPALQAKQGASYQPTLLTNDPIDGERIVAERRGRPLAGLLAMQGISAVRQPVAVTQVKRATVATLGLTPYQSMVDAAAPADHTYRYLVTAVFPRNLRDSEAHASEPIGVPYLTPPPAPGGVTGSFEFLRKPFLRAVRHLGRLYEHNAVMLKPSAEALPIDELHASTAGASSAQKITTTGALQRLKVSTVSLAGLKKPDYASNAVVGWQASSGPGAPFSYRLYRVQPASSSSRLLKTVQKSLTLPGSVKLMQTSLGVSPAPTAVRAGGAAAITHAPALPTSPALSGVQKIGALSLQSRISSMTSLKVREAAIRLALPAPPILVGETTGSTLKDGFLASAVGMDVDFLLVAKNQWGVESEPAKVRVHMKPTLAPSTPMLLTASPNPDQPDQVLLTALASPDAEEVTKYIVMRKTLPEPERKAPNIKFRRAALAPVSITHAAVVATPTRTPSVAARVTAPTQVATTAAKLSPISVVSIADRARMFETLSTFQAIPDASITLVASEGFTHILDSSSEAFKHYAYRIIAVNSTGLQSGESAYLDVATRRGSIPAPDIADPVASAVGVTITLRGAAIGQLVLERAQTVAGVDTDFIQVLGPATSPLMDRTVVRGQTYKYRVRAFLEGLSSPPSRVVSLTYRP
ncbi:MAG: hypothetical protein HYR64_07885 [Fimbriimonas ginsengisoli]|uniref:Fibronectin type-III domain-containing protein n=1 Tax=Fimbriimonas ginsengisoli TaxID=1005039 RepID=A0A931LT52_FIMGI|nr:hypothetical protein [Fimbriimonas ginsengisoli]